MIFKMRSELITAEEEEDRILLSDELEKVKVSSKILSS